MPTCPECRTLYPDGTKSCPTDGEDLLPDESFANADVDLAPGTKAGEYEVESKLGEGGFGSVYKAVHPLIGKIAAVKVLHRAYSSDPQVVSRFIAEARAVNQIRHPNIIDIFSFGRLADGRSFFVMEFLDGQSFEEYLRGHGRLSLAEAMPILRAIARAIDAAHAAGIGHRDLKPENIYLARDADGHVTPKLLDFGIAKLFGDAKSGHKTRTGAPIGTPDYMSPEQCRGEEIDHRTDIYSFGVLVHRVLAGRLPFEGESVLELLYKHSQVLPPALSSVCLDLPAELDSPVLAMLAKTPADRPASVGAALAALANAATGAGLSIEGAFDPRFGSPPSGAGSIRMVTGADRKQAVSGASLVSAQTLLQPPPSGSGATLIGAEKDVGSVAARGTSRFALVATALLGLIGVGIVVGLLMMVNGQKSGASSSAPAESAAPSATLTAAPASAAATAITAAVAGEARSATISPPSTDAPRSASADASASASVSTKGPLLRPVPRSKKTEYEDPFK